ncbi:MULTISPECIES: type II secretion system protein N [Diaphorobacter]|uniref:type II secretion system protein N n=1 Tax=Diaphorobacter TaxID=238749 RepID=UPI000642DE6B|nr:MULTISPECIES: type II secretion system protein N [Diaphorobacter]KLR59752.1 general secretion pathway protein C [Diaphorobacter sp. J5-51]UOB05087.1 general secretion pathway protein C [Diaphorobacter sp. LI3]
MVTNTYGRWAPRLATLLLWALAGATAVYWGLKLSASPGGTAPAAAAPEPVVTDTQALARLLGASPVLAAAEAAPSAASRFVLMGVLAGTASGGGAALIAVDGKPAKPYRVGANVEPGLVLQSLGKGAARLGASMDGATTLALEMPRKRP